MSAAEFLRSRAVGVTVNGRYSLANWFDQLGKPREFACRTSRISPFRMLVSVPVVGKIGQRVASYFSDFGNLEGQISDTVAGGFILDLELDRAQREKLARKLTWLEKRSKDPAVIDSRGDERIIPVSPHSTLIFADGSSCSCYIIDMSVSGVAVSSEVQPDIGTPLAVGACVGRVVRHFREGFAVKFVELQKRAHLERLIVMPKISPLVRSRYGRADGSGDFSSFR